MLTEKLKQLQKGVEFCVIAEYPEQVWQSDYVTDADSLSEFMETHEGADKLLLQWPKSGKYRMVISQ